MHTPNKLDLWRLDISYDIFCHNRTIAEHLYSVYSHLNNLEKGVGAREFWKNPKVSGKTFSYTSEVGNTLLQRRKSEDMYNNILKNLGELFRIDINPEDYPISGVRIHIMYKYPGMAEYIFNEFMKDGESSRYEFICYDNIYDIILEDSNTIAFTCRTWEEVNQLGLIFGKQSDRFIDIVSNPTDATQQNDDRIERSTHSLITSIASIIFILGIIKNCT